MKEQIREVQKYFEEKISNGEFNFGMRGDSIDLEIDGHLFSVNTVGGEMYQYSFDNFMILNCDNIDATKLIAKKVAYLAMKEVKTEIQAL